MKEVIIPSFGEQNVKIGKENKDSTVFQFSNVEKSAFDKYRELLTDNGYIEKCSFEREGHCYCAFMGDELSYFINFYQELSELYMVEEKGTLYFDHECPEGPAVCSPQITQIGLEKFGLSYAVRLSDGRYIIFDGGFDYEPDETKLFDYLKSDSVSERPRIAAWILTHPHRDHFEGFVGFMRLYGKLIDVDAIYFNFPDADDAEHFPGLEGGNPETSAKTYIGYLFDVIDEFSLKVYTPHTGQTYQIADANCEILSSIDDIMGKANDLNATSLVVRMELAGQVILWTADATFSASDLAKKHGRYLKSDIMTIPHHGCSAGKDKPLIEAYDLICPETCFLPASQYYGMITYAIYIPHSRYVMTMTTTKEVIVGEPQRTITLPYTPKKESKAELEKALLTGIDHSGACTWVFSGLNTANKDDLGFDILNMTQRTTAVILMELFFTDRADKIRNIRVEVESCTIKHISFDDEDLDSELCYPNSQEENGIVPNSPFAVRFISNIPIVVTNKNHKAAYYSINR